MGMGCVIVGRQVGRQVSRVSEYRYVCHSEGAGSDTHGRIPHIPRKRVEEYRLRNEAQKRIQQGIDSWFQLPTLLVV